MKCDVDTRNYLCDSVVLASGTTIFQKIVERMTNELTAPGCSFTAPAEGDYSGCQEKTRYIRWCLTQSSHRLLILTRSCELPDGSIHDEFKVVTPIRYELEDVVNELPDGNIITVGVKRFLHVEVLFQPNVIGEGVESTTLLSRAT